MKVLVDAFAVREGSASIVLEHMLAGWAHLGTDDEITVVSSGDLPFALPAGVDHLRSVAPFGGPLGTLWERLWAPRRVAKCLGVDAVLVGVPAGSLLGTGTRRAVVVYDLRHELRPHQFSRARRIMRRLTYGLTFARAGAFLCISKRTRDDLVERHPKTESRAIVARLGADHIDVWPTGVSADPGHPYALAFGHFANKNVDAVLDAWAEFCRDDDIWTLRLVGMGQQDRAAARQRAEDLGIAGRVQLMPWLDDDAFVDCFIGAQLVIFPSDFEGFGLPAVEALRRGIPVVVSDDAALIEVTGGHAEVSADTTGEELAGCIRRAIAHTPEQREAGRAWTDGFRWRDTARIYRDALTPR